MTIRVLLFAGLRETAGTRELRVDAPVPATVAGLRAAVAVACPPLRPLLANAAVAVNEEYADDTAPVQPGDVVALIPPVSGG
ncbi:MAG: molybdopterin converting factor subunit 1 [Dehalococcoidia bacterium]